MNKVIALALATLLGVAITTIAQAGKYYRWVDENGVTHYTATPPEDRPSDTIKLKSTPPNSTTKKADDARETVPGNTTSPPGQRPEIPTMETPQPAKLGQRTAEDARNCAIARRNLETLNTRTQVRVKDPTTGEYRYTNSDEQSQAKADAQAKIKQYCK